MGTEENPSKRNLDLKLESTVADAGDTILVNIDGSIANEITTKAAKDRLALPNKEAPKKKRISIGEIME